jgi:hypothetical protein
LLKNRRADDIDKKCGDELTLAFGGRLGIHRDTEGNPRIRI